MAAIGNSKKVKPQSKPYNTQAKMLTEVGQPGLVTSESFINEKKDKELAVPNRFYTFDQMEDYSAVTEPLNLTVAIQTNAISDGAYESSGSSLSKALAAYGNYILHNMDNTTFFDAVQNINTHIKNGYSLNEITSKRSTYGKYKGDLILRNLGPRSPKSIKAWVWDEYKRNMTHVIQKPLDVSGVKIKSTTSSYLGDYSGSYSSVTTQFGKHPVLSVGKLIHNVYNKTFNNPEGKSPLEAAFKPYQESRIMSEYEIIGVARNFGGVPVARVPDELLIRGNDPESYPDDARALKEIQDDLESAHAGRQTFFMLPSSLVEGSTSLYEWNIELLGIQGDGSQLNISEMIKRKTTEIYNCFNAGHLILGQNGNTSSYSLAESGTNTHATIMNRDLRATANTLEKLLCQMLDAQGFVYDKRDIPKFRWKMPDQLSLDELGKFIQRTKSVNGLTPAMLENVLRWANVSQEGIDLLDYMDKGDSRSGESQGTSGTGGNNQDNSTLNNENKQAAPLDYHSEELGDQTAILDQDGKLVTILEKTQ